MPDKETRLHRFQVAAVLTSLASIIGSGTMFFHYVEKWSWVDSYFFAVVTLSTVGYGDKVPASDLGKIGATVFIFAGLGVFAYAIQIFGAAAVTRQQKRLEHHTSLRNHPDTNKDTQ